MATSLALAVAGTALLILATVDVFITVLHHWGGAGPLAARLARGAWWISRRVVPRLAPTRQRGVLSVVGPALIPVTLAMWAGIAITGFALVYLAWMPEAFAATEQTPPPTTLGDALYVSGVTFFTLGFGEIVPLSGGMRFLSVLEAGAGFALITLGISYFTSVYTAFSRQKTLGETVFARSGGNGAAGFICRHPADAVGATILAAELTHFRDGLAEIRAGYSDYPIIHYFVAARPRESLLRLVFVAREVSLLLDVAVDPEDTSVAGLGRRVGLEHAADAVAQSLAQALFGGTEGEAEREARRTDEGRADDAPLRADFREARERLREAGFGVRDDADAEEEYVSRRRAWERPIRRCAEVAGEDWEEVRGRR
jgi:hypothetical protein